MMSEQAGRAVSAENEISIDRDTARRYALKKAKEVIESGGTKGARVSSCYVPTYGFHRFSIEERWMLDEPLRLAREEIERREEEQRQAERRRSIQEVLDYLQDDDAGGRDGRGG